MKLTRKQVPDGCESEHHLSADPLHGTELDTGRVGWEVCVENHDFLTRLLANRPNKVKLGRVILTESM